MREREVRSQTMDLDKILLDIGNFGKYQITVMTYMFIVVLANAIKNNQYVFVAGPVEYRCDVPQCESSQPEFKPGPWAKFALPGDGKCQRYVALNNISCTAASFSNQTESCYSWLFENENMISYEFNLACQEWKRTLVGTLRNVAYFATMPLVSYVSDTFGRRYVLIFTAVSPAFIGTGRAFSTNYIMFIILEFIEAFCGCGAYSTVFILALEMVNLKNRVVGGTILSCIYSIGLAMLGGIAWLVKPWRTLTVILYAPGILFIFYIWITEESVRWLISKGRLKEAAISILKATKVNKKQLDINTETTLKYFANAEDRTASNKESVVMLNDSNTPDKKVPLFKKVLRSKVILCRTIVVSFWWVTVTMVYYGLTINAVSLAGNPYVNFVMTALVEIPGYLMSMATLDRFGRKSSIMAAFLVAGLSLLLIGVTRNSTFIVILSMVGKLSTSMSFSSIYIYTVELFPTEARHQLMGFCSMVGRLGSMVAPQTPLLMVYMKSLPYIIFGIMSTIAGLLMLLTPETLKMKLPDTFEEAENINIIPRTHERVDILSETSRTE